MRTVTRLVPFAAGGILAAAIFFASTAQSADASAAGRAKPAAGAGPAKAAPKSKARASATAPPKTLEEITIEGEVRLPEVLFITSRDVERPLDWLDGYLTAEDSAAAHAGDAPVRVHVVPAAPAEMAASADSATATPAAGAETIFQSPATESAR